MQNPQRNISGERKATYYIGLALTIIGGLVFFSVFITAALSFGKMNPMQDNFSSSAIRGVLGMGMMILGAVLMNVGSRGLAGSGVILDPQKTRQDLEPWTRAAGGMVKDALDEADVNLSGSHDSGDLTFDEKLRKLEALRKEGLLTESEYQAKRGEILDQKW